jgi:hypothetical protein
MVANNSCNSRLRIKNPVAITALVLKISVSGEPEKGSIVQHHAFVIMLERHGINLISNLQ